VIVAIHTAFGIVALVAGAWNLLRPKGTRIHRRIGWIYAIAMYMLVVTSFAIFEVFGRFGAFHVLALVSGGTLSVALYFPVFRRAHSDWMEQHYVWMAYSYVGLIMATGSHFFELLPNLHYGIRAGLFWALPMAIGSTLIFRRKRRVLARARATYELCS
jgi:uncharacterized membrane protein